MRSHIKEEEKGFVFANRFWLQSTGAGSRGGSKVEQPVTARPRAERLGRHCRLSTQPASQLSHRPRSNPRGWCRPSGRGLPILTNVIKTPPPTHAHSLPWSRQSLTETLPPGHSRLHQVDRINHHTDPPTGPEGGTRLSAEEVSNWDGPEASGMRRQFRYHHQQG